MDGVGGIIRGKIFIWSEWVIISNSRSVLSLLYLQGHQDILVVRLMAIR